MAGMGFMIAAASRSRDERGRYAEGNTGNYSRMNGDMEMRRRRDDRGRYMGGGEDYRMGNDHSTRMGGYDRMEDNYSMDGAEMRQRRDSRGRYMEDTGGSRMAYDGDQGRMEYGGNESAYRPLAEPHIPPYLDRPGMTDMRRMEGGRMRDKNIVNIRDYQDKRRIGFGENRMHHGESKGSRMTEGGSHMTGGHDKLTREKAEKWVRSMQGDDPKSRGEMWTYEDAKMLAEERGLPTEGQDMVDYYVALNMVYNDYCKVAKEHGVDTEDYYADLAHAWLYDRDGKPPAEKLMAYKQYVVPHRED